MRIVDLEEAAGGGVEARLAVRVQLEALADAQMVTFAAGSGPDCLAELRPMAACFRLASLPPGRIVMSRFAHLRAEDGVLVAATPLGAAVIRILDASAASVLCVLASGADVASLIEHSDRPGEMRALLELLVSAGVASCASDSGRPTETRRPRCGSGSFTTCCSILVVGSGVTMTPSVARTAFSASSTPRPVWLNARLGSRPR